MTIASIEWHKITKEIVCLRLFNRGMAKLEFSQGNDPIIGYPLKLRFYIQ
jgi:hypothetical protein